MKRLLLLPVCFATACTFTISTATPPKKAVHHGGHKHHNVVKYVPPPTPPPLPDPVSTPELVKQVHDSYEPIYKKIPPL